MEANLPSSSATGSSRTPQKSAITEFSSPSASPSKKSRYGLQSIPVVIMFMFECSIVLKIGMLGDAQIGKTSLMVKYVEGTFDEDYIQTLGILQLLVKRLTDLLQVSISWKSRSLSATMKSHSASGIWEVLHSHADKPSGS